MTGNDQERERERRDAAEKRHAAARRGLDPEPPARDKPKQVTR